MSETTTTPQALTVDQAASALTDFFSPKTTAPSKEQPTEERSESDNVDESTEAHHDESASHEEEEEETSPADEIDDEPSDEEEDDVPQRTPFDEDDFEIEIDGKPVTIKGAELKSGYMRQSDYTKKTQEVAQERKALTAKQTEVMDQANVVRFQAHTKLEQFDAAVKQAGGWEKLRTSYPPEQVDQFTQMYVNAQKEAATADGIIQQHSSDIKEQNSKAVAQIFSEMSKTIHGFNSTTLTELDAYLTQHGFDTDMALTITHAPAWEMIYKAMKYDQAQARSKGDANQGKQERQEGKKHHSAPTNPVPQKSSTSRRIDKATDRLKEANKSRDRSTQNDAARSAIEELLKAGPRK